jgi:hypothetical protein
MAKFTIAIAALALGFGCDDKGDSVGEGDTDTDTDSDTDTDADPTGATVTVGSDTITVDLVGGSGSYEFGITETGKNAWEAEDCVGGTTAGFGPYCHTITGDSSTTIDCVKVPEDAGDNASLFCGVPQANHIYYFGAMDDSWCATSGDTSGYYDSYGCDDWGM